MADRRKMALSPKNDGSQQYVTFELDQTLMGIEISAAREIYPVQDITPVQKAPLFVKGLINLRGTIITVVDIGIPMGIEATALTSDTHVIILKHHDTGFLAASSCDVVTVDNAFIEKAPANINASLLPYIRHVVRGQTHTIVVLSVRSILRTVNG